MKIKITKISSCSAVKKIKKISVVFLLLFGCFLIPKSFASNWTLPETSLSDGTYGGLVYGTPGSVVGYPVASSTYFYKCGISSDVLPHVYAGEPIVTESFYWQGFANSNNNKDGVTYLGNGIYKLLTDMGGSSLNTYGLSAVHFPTISSDPCGGSIIFSDTGIFTPPAPSNSISFLFPANSTTTQDFNAWHTSLQITTSSDMYEACVQFSGSSSGTECQTFLGATTTLQEIDIQNSYFFANLTSTSTVTSSLYLDDLTTGRYSIATSSVIAFYVPATTSNNTTGTYTPPILSTSTIFNASGTAGMLMTTSTCQGWGNVGCALGNVFSNTINFLFGIDQNTIQSIAGFQLANTQPWSFVPTIENDIQNANNATGTFQTASLVFNLGKGNVSSTFFSADSVHMFISDSTATFIKNLIYLLLLLDIGFMVYLEIKLIFGHKKE